MSDRAMDTVFGFAQYQHTLLLAAKFNILEEVFKIFDDETKKTPWPNG